jgi:hypothetical protein
MLRRMTLKKVLGYVASWWQPYLVAKSSHVGGSVNGLTYPLHRPTTHNHQARGQGFLSGAVSSHRAAVVSGTLVGDTQPLVSGSCGDVDYLGTCIIDFYIGCMAFTRVCLPHIGIVMMCMHVFLVKLPFQTVMGRVPILEYMLSSVCGLLQPRLILSGNECFHPPRVRC